MKKKKSTRFHKLFFSPTGDFKMSYLFIFLMHFLWYGCIPMLKTLIAHLCDKQARKHLHLQSEIERLTIPEKDIPY